MGIILIILGLLATPTGFILYIMHHKKGKPVTKAIAMIGIGFILIVAGVLIDDATMSDEDRARLEGGNKQKQEQKLEDKE